MTNAIELRPLLGRQPADLAELRRRAAHVASVFDEADMARWEDEALFPEAVYGRLRESGLLGLTVPTAYGGEGRGVRESCAVLEELTYGCGAASMICQMFVNGPPRAIARLGNEDARQRYLPGVASGERYFAIAMSEADAGSAVTELTTCLRPAGDGFRLDGTKLYITGGNRADSFLVFCRAPGSAGSRGIGAVVVERGQAGFSTRPMARKMGGNAVGEAELRFDGVEIDRGAVIIEPDASSSRAALSMLRQFNPERCGNAAMSLGLARAALERAAAHVRQRRQFGRELREFQGLQWKIADMVARYEGARLLLARAAGSDEDGFPATALVMAAKISANEAGEYICREAMQLHGHWGYTRDLPLERYYRDARGAGIGGGTLETSRNVLAGEVLGRRYDQRRPRPRAAGDPTRRADAAPAQLPSLAPSLEAGLEVLREHAPTVRADEPLSLLETCVVLEELAASSAASALPLAQALLARLSGADGTAVVVDGEVHVEPTGDRFVVLGSGIAPGTARVFVLPCASGAVLVPASAVDIVETTPIRAPVGLLSARPVRVSVRNAVVPGGAVLSREKHADLVAVARCTNAAISVGVARGALDDALRRLRMTRSDGSELGEHQGLQWKVADMAIALAAARELTHEAARAPADDGSGAAMAKLVANEAARLICDEALQLHGRDGYWHGHVVAQRYRDARGLLLLDGTPEDMRNVIAASTLGGTPADAP
jgi:hypothetical protein